MNTVIIVGGGLAGDTAAEVLRAEGYGGRIVIVGDENVRPYDRPPLSKAVLGSADAEASIFLHPADWYDAHDVELWLDDACTAIDLERHRVLLCSGETIDFTKLLIATGAEPRRLALLDDGPVSAHYLRSLDDARALRAGMTVGTRVVVVGGGVIGMEVAANANQRGCLVTVIEMQERIMARCVSPTISDFVAGRHGERGVSLLCGVRLAAVQDRAGRVLLDDGREIPADLTVVGIGASPRTALAQAAGLRVDDGIVVDALTRTSHPDVHAAGDVTRFEATSGHRRAEHWRHAIDQATIAAKVMAGGEARYVEAPWIWTDQYGLNIQVTGDGQGEQDVLRGKVGEAGFILFHLNGGRLVGATSINQGRHKRAVAALVARGATIDPAVLADPTTDLKKLAVIST